MWALDQSTQRAAALAAACESAETKADRDAEPERGEGEPIAFVIEECGCVRAEQDEGGDPETEQELKLC